MQFPIKLRMTKTETAMIVVIVLILAAILGPGISPHWIETSTESCHICGNRRHTIKHYRWYRETYIAEEMLTHFSIPINHKHDWWQYDFNQSKWGGYFVGGSKGSRYKDGTMNWESSKKTE